MEPTLREKTTMDVDEATIGAHLPMKTVEFLIGSVLLDQDAHGYGIMKEISRRTNGDHEPGPATTHRALARMAEGGLIEETDPPLSRVVDDPRRRYYSLTPLGRNVVRTESDRRYAFLVSLRAGQQGGGN